MINKLVPCTNYPHLRQREFLQANCLHYGHHLQNTFVVSCIFFSGLIHVLVCQSCHWPLVQLCFVFFLKIKYIQIHIPPLFLNLTLSSIYPSPFSLKKLEVHFITFNFNVSLTGFILLSTFMHFYSEEFDLNCHQNIQFFVQYALCIITLPYSTAEKN